MRVSSERELGPEELDFGELFRAFAPYVLRVLRALGVSEGDLDDVSQEVFIILHRRIDRIEGTASLKAWIYGVCIRKASEYRRSRQRRREEPTETLPEDPVTPPQVALVQLNEAKLRLRWALERLDQDKRVAFVLYEFEELTLSEIADATGASINTVYSRLVAARKRVIAALGEEEKD